MALQLYVKMALFSEMGMANCVLHFEQNS